MSRIVLASGCFGLVLALLFSTPALQGQEVAPGGGAEAVAKPGGPRFAPQELLLQFKPKVSPLQRGNTRAAIGAQLAESIHTPVMQASGRGILERVTLPPGLSVEAALRALAQHPSLAYAEPNHLYQKNEVSNDPYYTSGQLWGMYGDDTASPAGPAGTSNPYGVHAEQAWNLGFVGSQDVIIAVIDEGMQVTHPDLVQNAWVNPHEIAGDGLDNDGNGFIDDIHGWDFFYNNNSVYDAGEDSHGTHVAGTIGGRGGNGTGVVGVNWYIRMISLKFLGPGGGSSVNAVKSLDYLVDLKQRHNLRIIACNNSWGGGGYSQTLHDAIIRAAKAGILFVAAAGNSSANNDAGAYYPCNYNTSVGTSTESAASYDGVISVASITSSGALSSFSSYGSTTVDLGAPGSAINSSVPVDTYASYNGTSMATPHVTGAIALYHSRNPGASAAFIKTVILGSATPTASLAGKTVSGGRLNVFAALQTGAYLSVSPAVCRIPDSLQITLGYPDGNTDPNTAQSVQVQAASSSEAGPELLTLTETGPNTGTFTGAVPIVSGTPTPDGQIQVAHADVISVQQPQLNLSATASVDALPPVISSIAATPTAVAARITWTTDELSGSYVSYGLSAGSLSSSRTVLTPVTSHVVTLSGLAPATVYYYQVASSDAAGNTALGPVQSFTTPSPAPILFVDDDLGALYERFFKAALEANSLSYDVWDVSAAGTPPGAADLALYPVVIWNTGYEYSATGAGLAAIEQSAIASYLNGGGRIFISGQDILWSGVTASFRTNYLKLGGYTDDITSSSLAITGVTSSAISDGLILSITKPTDYPSLYVDGVSPGFLSEGLFTHGVGTGVHRHNAVAYRGDLANGGFAMVFFAFPFEAISTSAADPNNQKTVLRRIVEYLQGTQAPPGIAVSTPSPAAITTEAGGSATFTVRLNSRPASTVTIDLASSDTSEITVSPATLTFTAANYGNPQTVTVTGVDDLLDDGDVTASVTLGAAVSTDPDYSGLDPADLTFSNTDNDTAGFTVSAPSPASTTEAGGTALFSVRLNAQPLASVNVPLASTDTTEGSLQIAVLTFTPENWNTPQGVAVTGVDDLIDDGNVAYSVVLGAATSTDPLYQGVNPADVSLSNVNDDSAGVTVSGLSGNATTEDGATVTFTVKLNSEPLAAVSIAVTSSDLTEGAASPDLLTFTAADWNTPRTVTITGLNDWIVDGDQAYSVVVGAASSSDSKYQGINPSDMPLVNADNDVPQVVAFHAGTGQLIGTYDTTQPVLGGSLADLQAAGGGAQTLREGRIALASSKQVRYTSGLEYRWTFPGVEGASSFNLIASRTTSSEVDNFQFQVSSDNGTTWANLALVSSATLATYTVNNLNLRGDLVVRVIDSNRSASSSPIYDTLTIDQMSFTRLITDFRPVITVAATDASAGEPANNGEFTFTRNQTSGALTVPFTVGGTAVSGTDYIPLPASVTFADGAATAVVVLQPKDDALTNPQRSVSVTVASSATTDYQAGTPASATINLSDDEVPLEVAPSSESTVSGSITSGSLASLQAVDGNVERLTELVTSGKTTTRQSLLEHRWTFQVGSTPVTGYKLQAFRPSNSENENFQFQVSSDNGATWVNLALVNATTSTAYSGALASLTGTILVRVVDTDRVLGRFQQDSISIDQLVLTR
ncbi:MAG: hypothetical protein RJA22_714 [Verrucomicrobiota bacterium]